MNGPITGRKSSENGEKKFENGANSHNVIHGSPAVVYRGRIIHILSWCMRSTQRYTHAVTSIHTRPR